MSVQSLDKSFPLDQSEENYAFVDVSGTGTTRQVKIRPIPSSTASKVLSLLGLNYLTYHEQLEGDKTFRTKVIEYYEENPQEECYKLLNKLSLLKVGLQKKSELSATGFKIWSKNDKQAELCNILARALNLDAFELQHHYHLQIVDMALPWWQEFDKTEERPAVFPTVAEAPRCPKWLEFIHPRIAIPANSPNKIILRPYLDTTYLSRRRYPSSMSVQEDIWQPDTIPAEATDLEVFLKEAAQNHRDVDLDSLTRLGVYYRPSYRWTRMSWENWPRPSMIDIAADIDYLEMCAQVDQNTLAQTKSGIICYGIGPDPTRMDIETNPPPTQQEVDELTQIIKNNLQNRFPMYIGRNDLTVRWITPPAELFGLDKYLAALARVLDWVGLPSVFWPVGFFGPGSRAEAYASSYVSVKPLRAHIEAMRRATRRWMERFLWEWCVDNEIGSDPIEVRHDYHVLVEDRQVLDNIRTLGQFGPLSQTSMLDTFGFNTDYEIARQQEEKKLHKDDIFVMRTQASQTPNPQAGRPNTAASPVVRPTDQPKPSTNTDNKTEEESWNELLEINPSINEFIEEEILKASNL